MIKRQIAWKETIILAAVVAVLLYFWNVPILYPFKMFVVFIHEMSHGIAAMLTGGRLDSITLSVYEGGNALTYGGDKVLIIAAGYVGSFIFGLIFLLLAQFKKISRFMLIFIGILYALCVFLFSRTLLSLGVMAALFVIIIIFSALGETLASLFLKLLGILTCLYAVLDIKSDLFFNRGATDGVVNDAMALQQITGMPAMAWSILFIVLIAVLIWFFVIFKYDKVKERKVKID